MKPISAAPAAILTHFVRLNGYRCEYAIFWRDYVKFNNQFAFRYY